MLTKLGADTSENVNFFFFFQVKENVNAKCRLKVTKWSKSVIYLVCLDSTNLLQMYQKINLQSLENDQRTREPKKSKLLLSCVCGDCAFIALDHFQYDKNTGENGYFI